MSKTKELREKSGLTQNQMSHLMGISQQAVSRLETGYENRKETKGHKHTLLLLEFIYDRGLLCELHDEIIKGKGDSDQ